jgi:hypothetical protein
MIVTNTLSLLLLLLLFYVTIRWLQLFYRACARELRRLEAQGLSPLYSLFGETLTGAPTLRAAAAQRHFMKVRACFSCVRLLLCAAVAF